MAELAKRVLAQPGDQVTRRSYVRGLFAFVEIMINNSFAHAKLFHSHGDHTFSLGELFVLEESQFALDDKGNVRGIRTHASLKGRLRFSFYAYAKAYNAPGAIPDYSDNGWSAFQSAIDIRHRITHPRTKEEFLLSEDDIDIAMKAADWFRRAWTKFMEGIGAALEKNRGEGG